MERVKLRWTGALVALSGLLSSPSFAAGPVQAELRSSAALLSGASAAGFAPSAPAGGAVVGAQPWICDAVEGLAPLIATDASADPILAVSGAGQRLPFLGNFAPATCGQLSYDGATNLYVAQGVLAGNTASAATGILRQAVDPASGQLVGSPTVIAANSGLGGNQPTAIALGPDGALYFGNLKNGDIKRILNPANGTTQVVQSVGRTPNGRPMRAMAFVGNDLYLGSSDSLSVITGATSPFCTGGCNGTVLNDGFAGVPHVGVTSDGARSLFFAVSGSVNQVWRYDPVTFAFGEVAASGVDRNGANASSFSFVDAKTNLLSLDAGGNLWIGDDPSHGAVPNSGRVWTISAAVLATTSATQVGPDPRVLAVIVAPWEALLVNTVILPTLNADGTFTITVEPTGAPFTTDSGTWTLTPPVVPSQFANPQAHLKLTNSAGVVLIEGDILLLRADQFVMNGATGALTPFTLFEVVFNKMVI